MFYLAEINKECKEHVMDICKKIKVIKSFFSKIFGNDVHTLIIIPSKREKCLGTFQDGKIFIKKELLQRKSFLLFKVLVHEMTHALQYFNYLKSNKLFSREDYEKEAQLNEKKLALEFNNFKSYLESHEKTELNSEIALAHSHLVPAHSFQKIAFPTLHSLGIEIELHGICVGSLRTIMNYSFIQFSDDRNQNIYTKEAHEATATTKTITIPGNDVGYDIPILKIKESEFTLDITLDHASISLGSNEITYSCFELVTTPLLYRSPSSTLLRLMKHTLALTAEIISNTADNLLYTNRYPRTENLKENLKKHFGSSKVSWPKGTYGVDHKFAGRTKEAVSKSLSFCPVHGLYKSDVSQREGLTYTQVNFTVPIEKVAYLSENDLKLLIEDKGGDGLIIPIENFQKAQELGIGLVDKLGVKSPLKKEGLAGFFSLIYMLLFIRMQDFFKSVFGLAMNKNLVSLLGKYNIANVLRLSLNNDEKEFLYKILSDESKREILAESIAKSFARTAIALSYLKESHIAPLKSQLTGDFVKIRGKSYTIMTYCAAMVDFIFTPKRRRDIRDNATPDDIPNSTYVAQALHSIKFLRPEEAERVIMFSQLVPKEYSIKEQKEDSGKSLSRRDVLFETRLLPTRYSSINYLLNKTMTPRANFYSAVLSTLSGPLDSAIVIATEQSYNAAEYLFKRLIEFNLELSRLEKMTTKIFTTAEAKEMQEVLKYFTFDLIQSILLKDTLISAEAIYEILRTFYKLLSYSLSNELTAKERNESPNVINLDNHELEFLKNEISSIANAYRAFYDSSTRDSEALKDVKAIKIERELSNEASAEAHSPRAASPSPSLRSSPSTSPRRSRRSSSSGSSSLSIDSTSDKDLYLGRLSAAIKNCGLNQFYFQNLKKELEKPSPSRGVINSECAKALKHSSDLEWQTLIKEIQSDFGR